MTPEISYSPSFAMVRCALQPDEAIRGEAGAMMAMSGVEIETSTQGGIMKGLRRSVLGGESFFLNTFHAGAGGGEVAFAPALPGDITTWTLDGSRAMFLQSGSFLACETEVDVDSSWGGARTFFSSEGLFMLRCTGVGQLIVSSYGAIAALDLGPGQEYTVDTGHMVGWEEGVGYDVRKVGNWKSTILGGEGLVVRLTGPGRVFVQTRSPQDFISWLTPRLPFNRA